MHNLNDTQRVLLSSAAARDDGSFMPFPNSLTAPVERIHKAIAALRKAGCAEEAEVQETNTALRREGDAMIGLRITDAGRAAIGAGDIDSEFQEASPVGPEPVNAGAAKSQTKTAMVLGMLQRADGATLAEIIAATGWLPHTTRAALTGLRKKSHQIEKTKRGDETLYRVASAV